MEYYLSLDGGGSKLQGILFDGDYSILACAETEGLNASLYPPEKIRQNILSCVKELLSQAKTDVPAVRKIYGAQSSLYEEALQEILPCGEICILGEGFLGLLTSGLVSGVCALSGTGSDIFYIENGVQRDVLGGWGYAVGDWGSGHAIGSRALGLVLQQMEGVRSAGLLDELIQKEYGLTGKEQTMERIYAQPSPVRYVASFCRCVNAAAQAGDGEAAQILWDAGHQVAKQAANMAKKHKLPRDFPFCTTGSVFRHCALMKESFVQTLERELPQPVIFHPLYKPVVGGLLYCRQEREAAPKEVFFSGLREACAGFPLT